MATQSEIQSYRSVIDGLSTVAFAQIKALLRELDNPNPIAFRDALLATYPELMRPYMSAASEVAAQWYTELRLGAGISSAFRVVQPVVSVPQLEAGVRYSLSPLFQPAPKKLYEPLPDGRVRISTPKPPISAGEQILSALAGFSQKMIANSGRDTIADTAAADPVRTGYARVPRAGCCAFCALMASRGAVYKSAETAGADRDFHTYCRCVVAPSFPGADNDYLTYVAKHFDDIDSKAIREFDTDGSLKSRLAAIRRSTGSK